MRTYPADGYELLDAGQPHGDVVAAIIKGWASAALDEENVEHVLDRLANLDLASQREAISALLSEGGQSDSAPTSWYRHAKARRLADDLWHRNAEETSRESPHDWLSAAINTASGRLAQFWLHATSADWRDAGDAWDGLELDARQAFERMLLRRDQNGRLSEVVLASQLHFFHAADAVWTEGWLLPRFDWADSDRAERVWQGFLYWGQPRDRLLHAGLLDSYLATSEHLDAFRDDLRQQFANHLAAASIYSEIDPNTWLTEFSTHASTDVRVLWMHHVAWLLRDLDADAADAQWRRWMQTYWQRRLSGVPSPPMDEESSALALWTASLNTEFTDAVNLALKRPIRLEAHSDLLARLADGTSPPMPTGKLVHHALLGTNAPFWDCPDLHRVVSRIRHEIDEALLNGIRSEALRLLCANAHDW